MRPNVKPEGSKGPHAPDFCMSVANLGNPTPSGPTLEMHWRRFGDPTSPSQSYVGGKPEHGHMPLDNTQSIVSAPPKPQSTATNSVKHLDPWRGHLSTNITDTIHVHHLCGATPPRWLAATRRHAPHQCLGHPRQGTGETGKQPL